MDHVSQGMSDECTCLAGIRVRLMRSFVVVLHRSVKQLRTGVRHPHSLTCFHSGPWLTRYDALDLLDMASH